MNLKFAAQLLKDAQSAHKGGKPELTLELLREFELLSLRTQTSNRLKVRALYDLGRLEEAAHYSGLLIEESDACFDDMMGHAAIFHGMKQKELFEQAVAAIEQFLKRCNEEFIECVEILRKSV